MTSRIQATADDIGRRDPDNLPTYACVQFWTWCGRLEIPIKLLLNTREHLGEENAIVESEGGPTDEGHRSATNLWYLDYDDAGRLIVVQEFHSDETDCDGRIEHHNKWACPFDELDLGHNIWNDQQVTGESYPRWKKQSAHQRDYEAERAGY